MQEVLYGFRWIFGLTDNPEKNSLVGKIRNWWRTWKWDPQKWLDDFGNWADKLLMEAADWIVNKLLDIWGTITKPWRDAKSAFGKTFASRQEQIKAASKGMVETDTSKAVGDENAMATWKRTQNTPPGSNKGKLEPTSQKIIDAAGKLKDAKAGKGNVHEQLKPGPTSFGFSPGKITYVPKIKAGVDADGVNWEKFGGWQNVVNAISSVWKPTYGTPTITSGKRSVEHNKKVGGLPTSKHLSGNAFDLRNWMIPAGKERLEVYKALKLAMSTDTRKITGDPHLDRTGQHEGAHFHFQAAAKGITERINGPKLYLAGEQGPELVHIQPISDSSMAGRNLSALTPMEMGMMGGGNTTVINNVDNSQRGGNTTAVIKTDINGQSPQGHNAEMH